MPPLPESSSPRNATAEKVRWFVRAIVILLFYLVFIFSLFPPAFVQAATQGQPGPTSSATVKITLRIPPKLALENTSRGRPGQIQAPREALTKACEAFHNDKPVTDELETFAFKVENANGIPFNHLLGVTCDKDPLPQLRSLPAQPADPKTSSSSDKVQTGKSPSTSHIRISPI